MGTRKNASRLTSTERDNFLRAVLTLKNTIANPAAPVGQQINIYDQFVALHLYTLSINVPGGGSPINMGHQNSGFGPWHRYYLLRFEQALQAVDPTVNLPYWDWSDHTATQNILFQDNFMGPNGGPGGAGGGTVQSGYFAFNAPTPSPAWWPPGLAGWRPRSSLAQGWGNTLRRSLGSFSNLATQADVLNTLNRTTYEGATGFRPAVEAGFRMHNYHHVWVGGNMSDPNSSPNDLIFFLHHCNIDRLWALWQINGHQGSAFYPLSGRPQGHNLDDPMWPWIGSLTGYSSNNVQPDVVLQDFTGEPIRRASDVLDHRSLGYSYDTEVVLAVALDQTGSMTGMTPDPMTAGAPDVTKWEAAKRGIAALLHDCELAFTAGEAYITAGIETFRTLATNIFTPIFPGTPYGLIKNGTPYSEVGFTGSIAPHIPAGGTPLAGALSDTENALVRPPFGNLPSNDTRYLFILTDGIETAFPLLSTLPSGTFANTVIFAMGFGVGSGWNGVDYATISNLVSKGKPAPPGVTQVFHGENAGVIDKFYTNSIAQAIGYTPSVDPIFELFPSEHVDCPFYATDVDESFMITAQGFDYSDDNWEFCLVAPDGTHCGDTRDVSHHHEEGEIEEMTPFHITSRKGNGRCTIFLDRNGADSSLWIGRWYLRAMYKMDSSMTMFMPSLWNMIIPVGSPPVRGPLYSRLNLPPSQRRAIRTTPTKRNQTFFQAVQGVSSDTPEDPCSVSVNVYSKSSIQSTLEVQTKKPFAGNDFETILTVSDKGSNIISDLKITARLVAPRYSIGNIFADLQTIPQRARKKYLNSNIQSILFDQAKFLADYEQKNPDALLIRDEELFFKPTTKQESGGIFRTHVSDNLYPGVYRVAVYVEGSISNGKLEPEQFSRVIQTDVPLGIELDTKKSKPLLRLTTPNKLVLSITPMDKLGNIASPASIHNPIVTINGVDVNGKHINSYTGQHQIEVTLKGKGIKLSPNGKKIIDGEASVDTVTSKRLFLKRGQNIKVGITLSDKMIIAYYSKSKKSNI